MMVRKSTRGTDLPLTALALAIWGSTHIVATEMLLGWHPRVVALLRAPPARLLLLVLVRRLPVGIGWGRSGLLGALNFSVYLVLLFVSAYRLPSGVAATAGAIQPLIVVLPLRADLGTPIRTLAVLAALGGILDVAMLVLAPSAALDPIGVAAGLGAVSMAFGRDCLKFCMGGGCPSCEREALFEDDGELSLRLQPLARRPFPIGGGMVQDQI